MSETGHKPSPFLTIYKVSHKFSVLEQHKDKTEIDFYVYIIDIPSIHILSKSLSGVEKHLGADRKGVCDD